MKASAPIRFLVLLFLGAACNFFNFVRSKQFRFYQVLADFFGGFMLPCQLLRLHSTFFSLLLVIQNRLGSAGNAFAEGTVKSDTTILAFNEHASGSSCSRL